MVMYKATKNGRVQMSAEEEAEVIAQMEASAVVPVPSVITMRQARVCLSRNNLLDSVNTAVAASDTETQLTWEYAQELRRDVPYINAIGAAINLTDAQIDALFIEAATL